MIPKIIFRFSERYNRLIKVSLPRAKKKTCPTDPEIKKCMEKIKGLWEKEEKKIFMGISLLLKLDWNWNKIEFYVVGKDQNFAFPLTVTCWKTKMDFIDILTHKLIHRLQAQHSIHTEKWNKYINSKYKKENRQTENYMLVHAVHHKIYLKLFNKKRLKKNLERSTSMPEYAKAYQIVEEIGANNMIKKFHEVTK